LSTEESTCLLLQEYQKQIEHLSRSFCSVDQDICKFIDVQSFPDDGINQYEQKGGSTCAI
jgi:hypothetical protein